MSKSELSERQHQAAQELLGKGKTKYELAEVFGVAPNTAKGYVEALRSKGVDVRYDGDKTNLYYIDSFPEGINVSPDSRAKITRKTRDWAESLEGLARRRAAAAPPLSAQPVVREDHSDFIFAISDTHLGDKVKGGFAFNSEWGEQLIRYAFEEAIARKKRLELLGYDFDNSHVWILGDILTNEDTYEHQAFHLDEVLAKQFQRGSDALTAGIKAFSEEFETVQVETVAGNHGASKGGTSTAHNMDVLLYLDIRNRIAESPVENCEFGAIDGRLYSNTMVRGKWPAHLRHGHESMAHVDKTSRSKSDWRGRRDHHQYAIGVMAHHHVPAVDWVLNAYPVLTCPSMKPGGEYAERIGNPDVSSVRNLAWTFVATDDRPFVEEHLLDDVEFADEEYQVEKGVVGAAR